MPAFFEKVGRGPWGGAVQETGVGGFKQAPQATLAVTPSASPYGPTAIRAANAPNRWRTRRMAAQQMMMGRTR